MLSSIPSELVNLERLDCYECPLITEIPPELVNLKTLDCGSCPLITSIPSYSLVNLETLYCSGCPLITSIPYSLVNLKTLWCCSCPLITSIPHDIDTVYCDKCSWLDHPENKDFKSNLGKLTNIQRNMKTLIKYKRFKRIVYSEQFARLWYHPSAGGGRRAKRRILEGL
jgi:Leucine-rich repeat (LRR) protein